MCFPSPMFLNPLPFPPNFKFFLNQENKIKQPHKKQSTHRKNNKLDQ